MISENVLGHRAQEIGRIKIGRKVEGQKYPEKLDHFLVTTMVRDGENFVPDRRIHDQVGEAPTELEGVLLFHTPEENFHSELLQYDGRKKLVSCDGEERQELGSGEVRACVKAAGGACDCEPYARLSLQLRAANQTLGVHTFRTKSWESVGNIQSAIREIFSLFGTCRGVPVRLVLYPAEVRYTDSSGTQKTATAYQAALVLAMNIEDAARAMAETGRLLQSTRSAMALTAGHAPKAPELEDAVEDAEAPPPIEADYEVVEDEPEEEETPPALPAELQMKLDATLEAARIVPGALPPSWEAGIEEAREAGDVARIEKAITEIRERTKVLSKESPA